MFKASKVCGAIAVLGAVLGVAGTAHAAGAFFNIGNITIDLTYYESGTLYADPGGSGLTTICASGLACDGAASLPANGAGTVGGIKTDTQGIFRVNTITNNITHVDLYDSSSSGYRLTGIFSGLYDVYATFDGTTGQFNTRSNGGQVRIWSNTTASANSLTNLAACGTGVSGGADPRDLTAMTFNCGTGTISGGTPWLTANFSKSAMVDGSLPEATFQSTWTTGSSATGSSSGFLDIDTAAGGAGVSWFQTGTMSDYVGRSHDMYFSNSFNLVTPTSSTDWDIVQNTGQVVANQAAPEPGSIFLAGMALMGMYGVSRRRKSV